MALVTKRISWTHDGSCYGQPSLTCIAKSHLREQISERVYCCWKLLQCSSLCVSELSQAIQFWACLCLPTFVQHPSILASSFYILLINNTNNVSCLKFMEPTFGPSLAIIFRVISFIKSFNYLTSCITRSIYLHLSHCHLKVL